MYKSSMVYHDIKVPSKNILMLKSQFCGHNIAFTIVYNYWSFVEKTSVKQESNPK